MTSTKCRLIVLAIALATVRCDCDDPVGSGPDSHVDMPNEIGALWTYEIYDSLTGQYDSLQVSITDAWDRGSEWTCHYSDSNVIYRVVRSGDTLSWWDDRPFVSAEVKRLVYPLTKGSIWAGPFVDDTAEVLGTGWVSVPAGHFAETAEVSRTYDRDFEGGGRYARTWIAPSVGPVLRHRLATYSDGSTLDTSVNQSHVLVEYDLNTFGIEDFPNNLGDTWTYEVYDSTNGITDTVVVSVIAVGEDIVEGLTAATWLYDWGETTDTQWVAAQGNLLWFFAGRTASFWDYCYEFPLAVGRNWRGEEDAFDCVAKESVSVEAGDFPSTFKHQAFMGGLNDYRTQTDWLAPGVGVVQRFRADLGFGPYFKYSWTLLRRDFLFGREAAASP